MASREKILELKVGDEIAYMNERQTETIQTIETKNKYPDKYGETDKCITINGRDWYFDEITIIKTY